MKITQQDKEWAKDEILRITKAYGLKAYILLGSKELIENIDLGTNFDDIIEELSEHGAEVKVFNGINLPTILFALSSHGDYMFIQEELFNKLKDRL